MNERIRELWNRAADLNARLQAGPNSWETEVNFMNTFAELIVRECADVASINQHQYNSTGSYVLKHFGVEE